MRDRMEGAKSPVARPCVGLGLAVALGALLSCATPVPRGCSGEAAQLHGKPGRLHVRVLLSRDDGDERHEVVLRHASGRIEAIGLTPMGTQAWRLVHEEGGIEVENRIGRHLGLSPRLAYDAIAQAHLVAGAESPDTGEIERAACGYRARVVRIPDAGLTPTPPAGVTPTPPAGATPTPPAPGEPPPP